ncbi:UNVERIFIED_CONTAM: Leucine-rich repeat-containing protein 56 [Gekko kuhli]
MRGVPWCFSPLATVASQFDPVHSFCSPWQQALTGLDDLRQVRALEMRVDTRENSLGNFGVYIPNLKQLKLNNSVLTSVRMPCHA